MPDITIYTDPLALGIAQMPIFTVGDSQNWSLSFSNGTNFYNPTGVTVKIGYVNGLADGTYGSAFQFVDRMNNQHTGSFAVTAGVPATPTWDENPIGVSGANGAWLIKGRTPPSRTIRKVYVKFAGTATGTAPAVRFEGGSTRTGQRATATATIGGGTTITAVTAVVQGTGYTLANAPEVIITGDGSGARAVVATVSAVGGIATYTVLNAGTGYTTVAVTVVDPEATATATVGGSSGITGATVTNQGMGYTTAPTIAFSSGAATATSALLNSAWGLSGLTLTGAGSGFTSAPTVGFSGGTGTGATAVAVVDPYQMVTGFSISNRGQFFGYNPITVAVGFSGGGGSGVAATATLRETGGSGSGFFELDSITLTNQGTGYTSAPTVTITVTGIVTNWPASVTSLVGTGAITSLTLTSPGSGYGVTAPTVGFTGGGGSGATATAQLIGSPISTVITITSASSGYTTVPAMTFSGGAGSGAAATALCAFGITAITVTQGGFTYTSLPALYTVPDSGALLIPSGIESHSTCFLQAFVPSAAQGSVMLTPSTSGRRDASGNLIYDDGLLLIQPQSLISPTFTLQGDGLTWAAVFTPVVAYVTAVLAFRRSVTVDFEVTGGGRTLFVGPLTIQKAQT